MADGTIERATRVGLELPDTPKIGQIFFLVASSPLNGMYVCTETGKWDLVLVSTRPIDDL